MNQVANPKISLKINVFCNPLILLEKEPRTLDFTGFSALFIVDKNQ